jgi:hypothetical protein
VELEGVGVRERSVPRSVELVPSPRLRGRLRITEGEGGSELARGAETTTGTGERVSPTASVLFVLVGDKVREAASFETGDNEAN